MKRTAHTKNHTRQSGFTAIEVAVVLVVIGLIFFTVTKGATMVRQSKLRKTAQMVEDIRMASSLFYREQGRLPGDTSKNNRIESGESQAFIDELIANKYMIGKKAGGVWQWQHPFGGTATVVWEIDQNRIILDKISPDDFTYFDDQFDGDSAQGSGAVTYDGSNKLKISL